MSPRAFPPELIDYIISFVWPDQECLRQCSLVCHAWLPASRYHLFYRVIIASTGTYNLFVGRVLQAAAMQSTLSSVEELVLLDRGDKRCGQLLFQQFAGRVPNLRHLRLIGVNWVNFPTHRSAIPALSTFSHIRFLGLQRCTFPSFTSLARFLVSFPALTSLALANVKWTTIHAPELWPCALRHCRLALQTLEIRDHTLGFYVFDEVFIPWILHTPSPTTLRTLSYISSNSTQSHVELFSSLGPQLVDLTLSVLLQGELSHVLSPYA